MEHLGLFFCFCCGLSVGFGLGFWLRGRPLPPYTEVS